VPVESEEEQAFQAALDAVAKRFEDKISGFLSEITGIRETIEAEFKQLDADNVALKDGVELLLAKSHVLVGSAGQFGHPDLTELARAVEEMCISIVEANLGNPDAFPLLFELTNQLENYKA